ncbi:MAG: NUDIX domain-containing protein [Bryobacteraceae bacterium]
MKAKRSAGILLYRRTASGVEVFLVHPGGPFWARKDEGAWSIPKGEFDEAEDPLEAARREFREETGADPGERFIPLGEVRLRSGKVVLAWAAEGDLDPARLVSNTFSMEWPPHSGRIQHFPEVDRGEWFSPGAARHKCNPAQNAFLDRLLAALATGPAHLPR